MTDIFISYAREDKERVRPIVEELEKRGWSVFWDRKIPPGHKWESSIGIALEKSRCVLAVWSEESINSDWVKDEATVAKKRGVLVPVVFDAVDQPMGFRQIQAADLSDWKNNSSHQAFQDLIGAIESKMSSADQPVIAPTPTPGPDPEPKPAPAKTLHYRSPNLKAVTQPALVVERGWFSKIKPKQAAIAVAVVLVVILLFVGLIGRKQEEIPAEQAPTALSTPAPLDAEAVKAKQEAAARKKQADEAAKVKAVVRQKAAELKARQKADSLRQVREAKLREKNEAAQLKARQETDARKQQAEEAARVKAEKKTADARQKAEKLKAEKETAAPVTTTMKVGDEYGGGKIAWIDATGKHGLIAAKADLPGADKYTWYAAKKACEDLVENGYSDWYLPSKDELNRLFYAKSAVGGFADSSYWSSTEGSAGSAWIQGFGSGGQSYSGNKYGEWRVRPVRRF